MIVFPEPQQTIPSHGVSSVGGAEKYAEIDASVISVDNLDAGNITAGSISASRIAAGSIDATKLSVSQLSAISADMGSITAGTITGGDIFSSSGATKIHLDNGDYIRFYASSAEKARIRGSTARSGGIIQELGDYFLHNDNSYCIAETNGTDFGRWGVNSSNQMVVVLPTATDQFLIKDHTEGTNLFTVSGTKAFSEKEFWINNTLKFGNGTSLGEHNIEGIDILKGYNDLRLQIADTSKFSFLNKDGTEVANIEDNGDINKLGSVSFRIPHPEDPTRDIHYPAVEAPEAALKIRGTAKLVKGKTKIQLPHHWELVTEETGKTTIQLTPLEDCFGLYAPIESLTNTSFVVKELMDGDSDAEFCWELTAVRKGYLAFKPEPLHTEQNGFKLEE